MRMAYSKYTSCAIFVANLSSASRQAASICTDHQQMRDNNSSWMHGSRIEPVYVAELVRINRTTRLRHTSESSSWASRSESAWLAVVIIVRRIRRSTAPDHATIAPMICRWHALYARTSFLRPDSSSLIWFSSDKGSRPLTYHNYNGSTYSNRFYKQKKTMTMQVTGTHKTSMSCK